ncbi:MAG: bifunctional folylpolyglutamate synthase/dihydrofolate synthase [Flavobacteriales bacterium]
MNYPQTLEYLYSQLPMFHRVGPAAYKPGLDNTWALLKLVGNPHEGLKTVHVAGTNGKGSTSHLIAASLQEAGYKTGLYTSPHLKDFRERIRINGIMIPEEEVSMFVNEYHQAWESIQPSFFEITVAMCFWFFQREKVDIVVIETGLGGRLDSTNVIDPEVAVITNIGYDHMNLLGDTIELIASEKAGIIKTNRPVVLGAMRKEAHEVMMQKAKAQNAPCIDSSIIAERHVPASSLKGIYQQENRATAYMALRTLAALGWRASEEHIVAGFANVIESTGLLGRWQKLKENPLVIADVAHNEDGMRSVLEQIKQTPHERLHVVLGVVGDKDVSRLLKLLPTDAVYYFCKADIPRGLDAAALRHQGANFGLKGEAYSSVSAAYKAALQVAREGDLVFVGGSVFTVAEVPGLCINK